MSVIANSPSLPIKDLAQYRRDVPTNRGIEELADHIDFEVFRPKLEGCVITGAKADRTTMKF